MLFTYLMIQEENGQVFSFMSMDEKGALEHAQELIVMHNLKGKFTVRKLTDVELIGSFEV